MVNVTNHAVERYSQRILGSPVTTIDRIPSMQVELIRNKIRKSINTKNILYQQMSFVDRKGNDLKSDIYQDKDVILIYDPITQSVITVYNINLGFDEDTNAKYISIVKDKIKQYKSKAKTKKKNYDELINGYDHDITECNKAIEKAMKDIESCKSKISKCQSLKKAAIMEKSTVDANIETEIKKLVSTMIQEK